MSLTYTEVEQQKNTRIFVFFAVVLLFYFVIAAILANVTKMFFVLQSKTGSWISPFLASKQLLYVLAFAFLAAVLHILYSTHNAISFIMRNLQAQDIDIQDAYHKRFGSVVDEVNVATGNKYKIKSVVIPTVAMNAFAISDRRKNAVIGVTEGLLSKLTRQQLQAVVAHEVAHVVSGDSFQTTVACSLFAIYAAILFGIREVLRGDRHTHRSYGRGSGSIILFMLIIYAVLSVAQFFYNVIRLFVSRDRELRADAIAIRLTRDPISLSEALYAISRGWRGLGFIDRSLEPLFIINPVEEAIDEKEGFWANLMSTHPPVSKRMGILAAMAHADVKNIQENVVSQEKLKESRREVVTEKKQQRWMLLDDSGKWEGPFTIPQIMILKWMNPATWVKEVDSEIMKQAKDEALLKPIFQDKMKGLEASPLMCPKCNQALIEDEYEGTAIEHCVFCEGVLVADTEVKRILIRREKGFDERVKKIAELTQKEGIKKNIRKERERTSPLFKCPKCNSSMIRNFYTMAYYVEVDRCYHCGHVWFDKDELEMLQYLVENKKAVVLAN